MLSRFLLILAGLFVGLWLRGAEGFLTEIGLPSLALLALILAVVAAPRATVGESRQRLEAVFGDWLDAWHAWRSSGDATAEAAFRSATHRVLLSAPDRVIRSLQAAERQNWAPGAVAELLVEMRRGTGRVTVTLRPEQVEELLGAGPASPSGLEETPARSTAPSLRS